MKAKKNIATVLILIALIGTASAAEFYVDPETGSMANDGSISAPWSTAEEVFNSGLIGTTVQAGDTIYLRTGYHGEIDYSNATNSDHITIEAETDHTPKLKRIKLKSSSKWILRGLTISPEFATVFEQFGRGIVQISDSPDIIIEDNNIFSVEDSSSWTAANWNSLASKGIETWRSPNAIIRNNTIKNVNYGIGGYYMHGNLIEYNTVEYNIGDGIQVYSSSDIVVQYNTLKNFYSVNNTHSDGIQFYRNEDPPNNNVTLRGNLIIHHDPGITKFIELIQGIGFFDGPYDNLLVENNVVIVPHLHGIAIYDATNSKIINNIAFHPNPTYPAGVYIHTGFGRSSNTIVRNNMANVIDADGTNMTASNNIDIDDYGPDALFADYLNNDLSHKPGSPAIDAGTAEGAPSIDILGNPRDSQPDVGAYELMPACQTKQECQDNFQCKTLVDCVDQQCVYSDKTGTCNDGDACTDNDSCSSGSCSGTQKNCADEHSCTTDSCSGGNCQHTPNDSACGTSTTCTTYTCNTSTGCQIRYNTGATCDDGIACTQGDSCNSTGNCTPGTPQKSQCPNYAGCTTKTCTTTGCQYTPTGCNIPPALVTWLKFEGNTNDETGTNNGTFQGGTPNYTQGKIGQALEFDGSNSVNLGSDSSIDNIWNGGGTFIAWIYPETIPTDPRIFSKGSNSLSNLVIETGAGIIGFRSTTYPGTETTTGINTGEWTYIAVTYDNSGTLEGIKIYFNGEQQPLNNVIPGIINDASANLIIGSDGGTRRHFNGKIDEVRIYNRALSETEILALFNEADQECIDTTALLEYISSWKQGSLGMLSLMQKLEQWKAGTGCP